MTPSNKILLRWLLRWLLLQLLIIVQYVLFSIIIGTIMDIRDNKFIRKNEPTFPYSHTSVSLIVVLFWVNLWWSMVYFTITFCSAWDKKKCILKFASIVNVLLVLVLVMVHVWAFIVTRRRNKRRTVVVVLLCSCVAAQPWLAF